LLPLSLLGPKIFLTLLSLNILILCSFIYVSHPYKTTGKIMIIYILVFQSLCFWTFSLIYQCVTNKCNLSKNCFIIFNLPGYEITKLNWCLWKLLYQDYWLECKIVV
jgi:hypothetical protein